MTPHDADRPTERRRHPHYVRRNAAFTFGLFGLSMTCLALGFVMRRLNLLVFAELLGFGFAAALVGMLISWFLAGETTRCPECGRRLRADAGRDDAHELTFTCGDCGIVWETGAIHDV